MPIARAALIGDASVFVPLRMLAPMLTAEAVLCPLTGLSAWLVWRRIDVGLERKRAALRGWGWLLLISALWSVVLNLTHSRALAVATLVAALAAACWTALAFRRLLPGAALLLVPYGIWLVVMTGMAITRF